MSNIDKNLNNGLLTKIWGPPLWTALHSISFGYPIQPTDEQRKKYKEFFTLIGDVLPCIYCRESYKEYINSGNTKLTDDVMKNRETITKWLYMLHEAINKKLGVDYGLSYEDVVNRYETYRAICQKSVNIKKGCNMPLDLKALSFKMDQIKDCPIIPIKLACCFLYYARLRGFQIKDFIFIKKILDSGYDLQLWKKINKEEWEKRNIECYKVISHMRTDGIPSLEEKGIWIGLPTIEELKLIIRLCSNLSCNVLSELLKILPKKENQSKIYNQIYKLTS